MSPPWRLIRKACRVAEQVRDCVDGPGRELETARQFAFSLSAADRRTRQLALVYLVLRDGKDDRLADWRIVVDVWHELDRLQATEDARASGAT